MSQLTVFEKLIIGTVQFGLNYGINNKLGQVPKDEVFTILNTAKGFGIDLLDTAAAYGNAEERIGDYHRSNGVSFRIITKFHKKEGVGIAEHIESALNRLNTVKLDVVLFHSFADYQSSKGELQALEEQKEQGRIGKIGVSVYTNQEMETLLNDTSIEVIQAPFNLLDNASQRKEVFLEAKRRGKTIHTRSVFLQGLFFKDVNELPNLLSPLRKPLTEISRLAEEAGFSLAELALNYALSRPFIDGVLIGIDSDAQLRENLKAVNQPLNENIVELIDKIGIKEVHLLNPVNWKF